MADDDAANWLKKRFSGKTLCFAGKGTGNLGYVAMKILPTAGARVVEEVSPEVDFLVIGGKTKGTPAAAKQAEKLNKKGAKIVVLGEEELRPMMMPTREEVLEIIRSGPRALLSTLRTLMPPQTRFDLRKSDLSGLDLTGCDLQSVWLDGSNLSGVRGTNVIFGQIANARFDGSCLTQGGLSVGSGCTFRDADLTSFHPHGHNVKGCDFSGARFGGGDRHLKYPSSRFVGADFSSTTLNGSDLTGGDLTNANFKGAKMRGILLVGANLTGADFTGADMLGAQLQGATVDGAQFASADVTGVRWNDVKRELALGIEPDPEPGPHLVALEAAARDARLQTTIAVVLPGGVVTLSLNESTLSWTGSVRAPEAPAWRQPQHESFYFPSTSYGLGMLLMARRWRAGTLQLDSLTLKAHAGPVESELAALTVRAWCEAFGLAQPDAEVIARTLQPEAEFRDRVVREDLKGGPEGIARWNARTTVEIARVGSLRGQRFDGAEMSGVSLHGDLAEASLRGAILEGANLSKLDARGADFSDAKLQGAHLEDVNFTAAHLDGADLRKVAASRADFSRAVLTGANLEGAQLFMAVLCGAKLGGAKLDGATVEKTKYDERTVLPDGHTPALEMQWAGKGQNPFFDTKVVPETLSKIDFDAFVKSLRANARHEAFYGAMEMLKSSRYKLFLDLGDSELVGVVRSQSDKELVYSCRLASDGAFACCTQNLKACGGLRGKVCKHIVLLLVGSTKAEALAPELADRWILNSRRQKAILDKDKMSATFLRYQSALAGEVDWRPTETVPEDYLAVS